MHHLRQTTKAWDIHTQEQQNTRTNEEKWIKNGRRIKGYTTMDTNKPYKKNNTCKSTYICAKKTK